MSARFLLFKLSQYRRTLPTLPAILFFRSPLGALLHCSPPLPLLPASDRLCDCPVRSLVSSAASASGGERTEKSGRSDGTPPPPSNVGGDYPTGEFEMKEVGWWKRLGVQLRLFFALPWERIEKGSVLKMQLRGKISDQLWTRFSSGLSLPQICDCFLKAAYDPRISGIYLHIEPLDCGWGKLDEIRRHILNFKKSGKFIVSYVPVCREKEYYIACACGELYVPPSAYVGLYGLALQTTFVGGVLEKAGIDPEVHRIGPYKSVGEQLTHKSMSKEVREMFSSLLDRIYENWLETISLSQGKRREEIENFLNSGVYQVEKLKEEGWITNIMYDDEVLSMLKERLGQKHKKKLLLVGYSKYVRVRKSTLGLDGGKEAIAIIRASGAITRTRNPFSFASSGIIAEQLIEKIRSVRESNKFKAVILRIDSPGGDALASDLIWREIKLLAASKPVIASMSDVAASGGYYMAMAAGTILAENLTLTASIGVVKGRFSLHKLYGRIDLNKEILSRGHYAELNVADQRPLRPDEAELFAKSTQYAYKQFRDKAASSRSMTIDQMEEVAQGRVWTGKDAAPRGLVDAIGGFSRAIAIAKFKANIDPDSEVRLVEVSRPSPTLTERFSAIKNSLFGLDIAVNEVLQNLRNSGEVQARMDDVLLDLTDSTAEAKRLPHLIKDCFG
ncbi:serine protease SPPA, chloroplastic-like [Zingiber officinale]|uniref:serine protease SPPA, chloroplastic-like n=1 Tax=Zingiber officinale TaxID=94328 RepID=UPI001C4D3D7A|nr:serine protease SPPA, chloroplastic-like [Zingiber officinale]